MITDLAPHFDGMSIDIFDGRFKGTFEVPSMSMDEECFFLVRGRVTGASLKETPSGDLKRTNVFDISDVVIVDNDEAFKLSLKKHNQQSLDWHEPDLGDEVI